VNTTAPYRQQINYNEKPTENEPEILIVLSILQSHIRMINDRKQQCKGSNLRTQKHCTPYKLTTETQVLSMHQCLRLGVALVEQEKMATVGSWSRFRFLLDESLFFCLSVRFCINCCHCYPDCALV